MGWEGFPLPVSLGLVLGGGVGIGRRRVGECGVGVGAEKGDRFGGLIHRVGFRSGGLMLEPCARHSLGGDGCMRLVDGGGVAASRGWALETLR